MSEPFPFAARALVTREAQQSMHEAFSKVTRRGDPTDPKTRRWHEAVEALRVAVNRAYPDDFRQACQALGRGDTAYLEPLIAFLEADPIFFQSGYAKEWIIRRLKRVALTRRQRDRLQDVVVGVVRTRDCREFRGYCQLARQVDGDQLRVNLSRLRGTIDRDVARRARWVLDELAHADSERRRV
jgi:hypothetical protein